MDELISSTGLRKEITLTCEVEKRYEMSRNRSDALKLSTQNKVLDHRYPAVHQATDQPKEHTVY